MYSCDGDEVKTCHVVHGFESCRILSEDHIIVSSVLYDLDHSVCHSGFSFTIKLARGRGLEIFYMRLCCFSVALQADVSSQSAYTWACLHVPAEHLPTRFVSSAVCKRMQQRQHQQRGSGVQVVHVAAAAAAAGKEEARRGPQQDRQQQGHPEEYQSEGHGSRGGLEGKGKSDGGKLEGIQMDVRKKEAAKKVQEKRENTDRKAQADWIRRYMQESAEEEEENEEEEDSWERLDDSKVQRQAAVLQGDANTWEVRRATRDYTS